MAFIMITNESHGKAGTMTDNRDTDTILEELLADPRVQEMKRYKQHGRISTFEHCERVARLSCRIDRALHLHADPHTLVKGAMLHDFYLYDWHNEDGGEHDWHGYIHAERARRNACRYFGADERVQHVIYCHMWPLNRTRVPRTREAWIVCLADKYISIRETLLER